MARGLPPSGEAGTRRRPLIALVALAAVTLLAAPSRGQDAPDEAASAHVTGFVAALEQIARQEPELAARIDRTAAAVEAAIGWRTIARYAAGPAWEAADEAAQAAYLGAYGRYLNASIARRMDAYTGEIATVLGTRPIDDGDILVATRLASPGAPTRVVQWRVRLGDAGPAIVDILVDGASLVVNQREEFAAVLAGSSGGLAPLTDALAEQTARLSTPD
ncbi:MAG: ABC transporter substrate-binding protein [Rhodospirillaceae bacterium]|nr:ABC transporter substrate-binding protein [Rhodospirillaceae bacterium]